VHETLKAITRLVLNSLKERYADKREQRPDTPQAVAAAMGRGAQATATTRPPAPQPTAPTVQAAAPVPPPRSPAAPVARSVSQAVEMPPPSFDDLPEFADLPEQSGQTGPTVETGKGLQDFSFEEFESGSDPEPLSWNEKPKQAPAPADTFDGADDQILELADDNLVLEADESFKLDLAEVETPFASSPATPAPLDVTAEVFRAELPSIGDEFATDQAIEPIPLSHELESDLSLPSGLTESGQFGEIDYAPGDEAATIVSEDHHDDPLDLEPEQTTSAVAVSARRGVAEISAVPSGSQTIDLPISLEIGGKSISFRLKVSLEAPLQAPDEAPDDTHKSGARS
jgi:hypothetical protein